MADVTVSLWLPVGRANFYSTSANGWLSQPGQNGERVYFSHKLADSSYVPVLQCSVLRRVLEVLPRSFGYDYIGAGTTTDAADEPEEIKRPTSITLTLTKIEDGLQIDGPRQRANAGLAAAGVREVAARVDELGNYSFTATVDGPVTDEVRRALQTHVREVFGGKFDVRRLVPLRGQAGIREGAAAVRRYNGLAERMRRGADLHPHLDVDSPPLGILTFFQLNTIFEGVANLTLSPAVFFERYRFMQEWKDQKETAVTLIESVADFIEQIETDQDGRTPEGRVIALRHFLAVTSRETLQKMKWSVESVRRNLLNEMMSVLHRQSRLVQLDLAAIRRERTPELAGEASETQLRGYVTLIAAKLPLVANVYQIARIATDRLTAAPASAPQTPAAGAARQLQIELEHWKLLLDGLEDNVESLEKAVEQAWMERLLYEQQQSRSEQEAISEIERSRYGQPAGGAGERSLYDFWNLILALVSVLFVIATTNPDDVRNIIEGNVPWGEIGPILAPLGAVAIVLLVVLGIRYLLRGRRARRGESGSHSYEFAFVLDEETTPQKVMTKLKPGKRADVQGAPKALAPMTLTPLGGGRIERVSNDSASIKMHSVVVFKVKLARYARFEIVHEIRASLVSDEPRYHIHQIRVFGDSPVALPPEKIKALIDWIDTDLSRPLFEDEKHADYHPASLLKDFLVA